MLVIIGVPIFRLDVFEETLRDVQWEKEEDSRQLKEDFKISMVNESMIAIIAHVMYCRMTSTKCWNQLSLQCTILCPSWEESTREPNFIYKMHI